MVAEAAAVVHGGRDAADLHAERLRIQELQRQALSAITEAETARDSSRLAVSRTDSTRQQAELDLHSFF